MTVRKLSNLTPTTPELMQEWGKQILVKEECCMNAYSLIDRYVCSSQGKYVEAKKCFLEVMLNILKGKFDEIIVLFHRLLDWNPAMKATRKI